LGVSSITELLFEDIADSMFRVHDDLLIPEDYWRRKLDSHCELAKAYDDIKAKEEDRTGTEKQTD
jgi:hypothetical protein